MFGYIKPFKPHLRYFEYEIYSSFYCGLCKSLGKQYGQIFRLMLSYDFTFLGLLDNAYNSRCNSVEKKRCIVHPFKKRCCLCCDNNLDYTTAIAVISVYHKICDEIADRGAVTGIFFRLLRTIIKKSYKKAAEKYPVIAQQTEFYMRKQLEVEHNQTVSLDKACDPTAMIMSLMAENISDDEEDRKKLAGFGYHLGRFVYIADAYDDIEKDIKKSNYNPLLLNFSDINQARSFAMDNIRMSLGQLAEYYSKLNIEKHKDILDNVIYLGLPNFHNMNKTEIRKNKNNTIEI